MRAADERVVYDAVDEAWLRPSATGRGGARELGVPADAPCLGIAGNIQEWKGQHVLVEAMASSPRSPDVHCVIVGGVHRAGEGYAASCSARIAALGLAQRVHFIGFRDDIPDVMNAWDVVVHASVRPEPFGRVILEGMLLGKPVIATAAGGVPGADRRRAHRLARAAGRCRRPRRAACNESWPRPPTARRSADARPRMGARSTSRSPGRWPR